MSPATDMYATATMLYELLVGVPPFPDHGQIEDLALLFKHAYGKPVPLRDMAPGLPDSVAAVMMRALATEPADRFELAESFGAALAGADTQAWGEGWLAAEQVPIMDAGPFMSAASLGTAPAITPARSRRPPRRCRRPQRPRG